ncbi:sensor histidine kinase [Novosphingobium panipatense]|uniref:sensor histidine kinase n=1 Tax=Novosphingobium panipatense TaxID=428991 RepID=UPI0036076916
MSAPAMPARAAPRRQLSLAPRAKDLPLLLVYGFAFGLLNWAAHLWGGPGFFSLWYPAAGLRLAVLWHCGLRLTPWLIVTELVTDCVTGAIPLTGSATLSSVIGAARPGVTCGVALAATGALLRGKAGVLTQPPMPLGLAAIAAPIFNALAVPPLEFLFWKTSSYRSGVDVVISLTGLAVGDVLGILILAPPILWLAGAIDGGTLTKPRLPRGRLLADALPLVASLLTAALARAGLGVQAAPSLLGGAWIGLRHGRAAAWLAISAQAFVFLTYSASAGSMTAADRLELHIGLAAVVLVTWLAGSFADTQTASQALLDRRNRLLFQAERLKTLRAMSVAVIHEVSQPLSTLAIEAAHLRKLTEGQDTDLAESAALIDRKAQALSEMVRRLRRFGGRDVDEPSLVPLAMLVKTACQIVAAEAGSQGRTVDLAALPPDLVVQVQEIELIQALVNLLRNALAASPQGTASVAAATAGEFVKIIIANPRPVRRTQGAGMGVGLIIARTIVEAHGGTIVRDDDAAETRFVLSLPLSGVLP